MTHSPLDLLNHSSDEQTVIRCLIRQPRQTKQQLAHKTNISLPVLDTLLMAMVQQAQVVCHESAEPVTFSAHFTPQTSNRTSSLLDSIFGS